MISFPSCKINLGLNVVGKRTDGFHNLETIFFPVPLQDALEIIPAPNRRFQFSSTGLDIPGEQENNLCIKAFNLLRADFKLPPVHMHLHKVIPVGSGLGGGSSDGAVTLKLLNELFSLALDAEKLKNYARLLGSDCAFFIDNKPVFGYERGDSFEPFSVDLAGLFIALVIPPIHVSTAEAYALVVPEIPQRSLKELVRLPVKEWKDCIVNDFEAPITKKYPSIGMIGQKLYQAGALFASMSGSGSAVFGLFEEIPELRSLFPDSFVWTSQPL